MDPKFLSNSDLLNAARSIRSDERRLERKLIEYVAEIESRRLYAEIGYATIHDWLVRDLGYSESSAYRRMMAARALRAMPEVAEKIEDGSLSLSSIAKVQSAIRKEERRTGKKISIEVQAGLIEQSENKTLRETEQVLVEQFPSLKIQGTSIALTNEQLKDLERVRELRSHANSGASLAEIIGVIAKDYLDRNDPLRREIKPRKPARDSSAHGGARLQNLPEESTHAEVNLSTGSLQRNPKQSIAPRGDTDVNKRCGVKRVAASPSTENFVRRKAGDACEFQGENGNRCGSRYHTQVEHIVPVALGGSNEIENLKLLCRTHNLLMAERAFGKSKLRPYRHHARINQTDGVDDYASEDNASMTSIRRLRLALAAAPINRN